MAERQDKGRTYKNFCKSCNCTGGKAKDLLYSEEELKEMARKQSVSISKTYKKNKCGDGKKKFQIFKKIF